MQSGEDLKTKILMNSVEGRWSVLGWGHLEQNYLLNIIKVHGIHSIWNFKDIK